MNYLKQLFIILAVSLTGEILSMLIPLPVPASIYGIALLFFGLLSGVIPLDSIRAVSSLLIAVMPVMFVPAAVGLMESFSLLIPSLFAYAVIIVVSTVAVMVVSGRVAQSAIRKSKEEDRHA